MRIPLRPLHDAALLFASIAALAFALTALLAGCDAQSPLESTDGSSSSERPSLSVGGVSNDEETSGGSSYALQKDGWAPSRFLSESEFEDLQLRLARDKKVVAWLTTIVEWHERNWKVHWTKRNQLAKEFEEKYGMDSQIEIPEAEYNRLMEAFGVNDLLEYDPITQSPERIAKRYPEIERLNIEQAQTVFARAIQRVTALEEQDAGGYPDDLLGHPGDMPSLETSTSASSGCDAEKVEDYNTCYHTAWRTTIFSMTAFAAGSMMKATFCLIKTSTITGAPPLAFGICGLKLGAELLLEGVGHYGAFRIAVEGCKGYHGDHGCECIEEDNWRNGTGCKLKAPPIPTGGPGGGSSGGISGSPYPFDSGWLPAGVRPSGGGRGSGGGGGPIMIDRPGEPSSVQKPLANVGSKCGIAQNCYLKPRAKTLDLD